MSDIGVKLFTLQFMPSHLSLISCFFLLQCVTEFWQFIFTSTADFAEHLFRNEYELNQWCHSVYSCVGITLWCIRSVSVYVVSAV